MALCKGWITLKYNFCWQTTIIKENYQYSCFIFCTIFHGLVSGFKVVCVNFVSSNAAFWWLWNDISFWKEGVKNQYYMMWCIMVMKEPRFVGLTLIFDRLSMRFLVLIYVLHDICWIDRRFFSYLLNFVNPQT